MENWGAGGLGAPGWPQIPPGLSAIASRPVLGERPEARCVLRRIPDITPFPSAVSSSKCSPDLTFFFHPFLALSHVSDEEKRGSTRLGLRGCELGSSGAPLGFVHLGMPAFGK